MRIGHALGMQKKKKKWYGATHLRILTSLLLPLDAHEKGRCG